MMQLLLLLLLLLMNHFRVFAAPTVEIAEIWRRLRCFGHFYFRVIQVRHHDRFLLSVKFSAFSAIVSTVLDAFEWSDGAVRVSRVADGHGGGSAGDRHLPLVESASTQTRTQRFRRVTSRSVLIEYHFCAVIIVFGIEARSSRSVSASGAFAAFAPRLASLHSAATGWRLGRCC